MSSLRCVKVALLLIYQCEAAVVSYALHSIFPYEYPATTLLDSSIDGQEEDRADSESGGTHVEAILVSETKAVPEKGVNDA